MRMSVANALMRPYIKGMKRLILPVILTAGMVMSALPAKADVLAPLLWKKRVLILFDASRSSAPLDRQIDIFRQRRSEMEERDLVAISNPGKSESATVMGYLSTPAGTNRELRNRFKPADSGLTIVLVGKDGTEKGRWQKLVQADEIFDLIDSMPMRKKEMKEEAATN